uniref:Reverse transcriptase domain-containing protein n=1 Tax=Amphimedon queenslandica TaxID=400682 RepID=A0A1X7TBW4_AMPQE
MFFRHNELKVKCRESKKAWSSWNRCGRPANGPLFDNLQQKKYEVRQKLKQCYGNLERQRIQDRDQMFRTEDVNRYRIPRKKSIDCYDDIELKEVEGTVKYLKNGKSPGPDGISAEHLKHDKAFDSIEYDVLLNHLFLAGVNGKTWRLIKSWYSSPTSKVRFTNELSQPFILSRGVKQGSVLSPILFCLVMNRMSVGMDADRSNLHLTWVSVGCASHADDIPKCLGVWWSHDLSSRKSIEENIKKARRAFFALGAMNVYDGKCIPLTSLSVFNAFVLPILLYGCETWFLTDPLLNLLDKFQAEVGIRILKLPVTHNLSPLIGLHWPSFRVVILNCKLRLLSKLLSNNTNDSSGRVFRTLAAHDLLNIGLVEQCRELELSFGTDFLAQCLHCPDDAIDILCGSRPVLVDADWKRSLEHASSHSSLCYVCSSEIVDVWLNLWNVAQIMAQRILLWHKLCFIL